MIGGSPPLTSSPCQLSLVVASARQGPYNTIRLEAVSVGASRFQVSSPATAYIASNAIEDHCCHHCCQWTQNDVIDPG